jgi:hypothetical protein
MNSSAEDEFIFCLTFSGAEELLGAVLAGVNVRVFVDEVHLLTTMDETTTDASYRKAMFHFFQHYPSSTRRIIIMTATPNFMMPSSCQFVITTDKLNEAGLTIPIDVHAHIFTPEAYEHRTQYFAEWLDNNPTPCLVMTNTVAQAAEIRNKMSTAEMVLQVGDKKIADKNAVSRFMSGESTHMATVQMLATGFDRPSLTMSAIIDPRVAKGYTTQSLTRVSRHDFDNGAIDQRGQVHIPIIDHGNGRYEEPGEVVATLAGINSMFKLQLHNKRRAVKVVATVQLLDIPEETKVVANVVVPELVVDQDEVLLDNIEVAVVSYQQILGGLEPGMVTHFSKFAQLSEQLDRVANDDDVHWKTMINTSTPKFDKYIMLVKKLSPTVLKTVLDKLAATVADKVFVDNNRKRAGSTNARKRRKQPIHDPKLMLAKAKKMLADGVDIRALPAKDIAKHRDAGTREYESHVLWKWMNNRSGGRVKCTPEVKQQCTDIIAAQKSKDAMAKAESYRQMVNTVDTTVGSLDVWKLSAKEEKVDFIKAIEGKLGGPLQTQGHEKGTLVGTVGSFKNKNKNLFGGRVTTKFDDHLKALLERGAFVSESIDIAENSAFGKALTRTSCKNSAQKCFDNDEFKRIHANGCIYGKCLFAHLHAVN